MSEGLNAILQDAAKGDQTAWRAVVESYGPRVFGLLRSRCGDSELAEEIAQSVFCTVAEKLGTEASGGYVEQGRFEAWIFRIAINRLRDEMRRRQRQAVGQGDDADNRAIDDRPADADPELQPEIGEDRRIRLHALREAMAEISEADRQIVELRHLGGLSFKRIAEILDEPMGTVLARQHRALRKLKNLLADQLEPCEPCEAGETDETE